MSRIQKSAVGHAIGILATCIYSGHAAFLGYQFYHVPWIKIIASGIKRLYTQDEQPVALAIVSASGMVILSEYWHAGSLFLEFLCLLGLAVLFSRCHVKAHRGLYLASGAACALGVGYCIYGFVRDESHYLTASDLEMMDPSDLPLVDVGGPKPRLLTLVQLILLLPALVGFYMPLEIEDEWTWYCYLRPFTVINSTKSPASNTL